MRKILVLGTIISIVPKLQSFRYRRIYIVINIGEPSVCHATTEGTGIREANRNGETKKCTAERGDGEEKRKEGERGKARGHCRRLRRGIGKGRRVKAAERNKERESVCHETNIPTKFSRESDLMSQGHERGKGQVGKGEGGYSTRIGEGMGEE
uniref:Uncharacterized protein n=1 Tax=Ixodes ricinus TaxID=34613 RepID=A0A6B0UVI2_IXORI